MEGWNKRNRRITELLEQLLVIFQRLVVLARSEQFIGRLEHRRIILRQPRRRIQGNLTAHPLQRRKQILRASRNQPEQADGDGWTYAHHQDLAVWRGRLYAAWATTPKDEDVPPYKVVYATSTDGITWSAPADLFPRENAWACRFYFYRASNGCMLALCAGKSADGTVQEAAKKVLLVRRITAEHQLDKVFTLVTPLPDQPPPFDTASDPVFVAACREAAGNNLLLEQQDYGRFLGDRRMKWHDDPTLKIPGWCQFGKAFC
ncbi:MAG: sialidase family protein, partial [Atribacterota bacterium]